MPEHNFYDYLIVGQGLAGSLLAWRLILAGKKVRVLDDRHRSSSTMVAAGVVNPLGGKRFNHSPQVLEWLQTADTTYAQLAKQAGRIFWQPMDMWRLFREQEQYRFHARLSDQTHIRPLLGAQFSAADTGQPIHAPLGGFIQHGTGYVRLPSLLGFLAEWLQTRQALQHVDGHYSNLQLSPEKLTYAGLQARNIIFCDGYRGMHNPWFRYLPFTPDKGEILTLQRQDSNNDHQLPNRIINGANWLLPIDDGKYRLGSTHNHQIQDNHASEAGVSALMKGLNNLLLHPQRLKLIRSDAGVRPATSDRQPFLGTHPNHPEVHIFNGFGAHGSLTIPWYSQRMCQYLLQNKKLPVAADIRRYNTKDQGTT